MWDVDDAVSNGACSDPQPSSVNGTDGSSMPAAATASCWISSNSENHPACHVASKVTNENTVSSSLKRIMCHSPSSEASDSSILHGDASSSADIVAKPPSAASINCHSVTRTNRHLCSDSVTDDDGYFVNNTHCNTSSASNMDAVHVCESVCSDYFSANGVDVRSSLPKTSVNESIHSDDHVDHNSARLMHDGRCLASGQSSVGADANSTSTTNTDLTETLTSVFANADLCDDGYMDEIDVVASSTMVEQQHSHTAAWLVETDACLDDFIDADMPHNAAVACSPSSSSLSSTHDESSRIPEDCSSHLTDRITNNATNKSQSDVSVYLQRPLHESLQLSSRTEERGTVASNCPGLAQSDCVGGLHNQNAACSPLSQTQPSRTGSCLESDTVIVHACHGANMHMQGSNPASESSHDTPPASLPSPSDEYCGNALPMAAAFLTAVADEQIFGGLSTGVSKHSETRDRPVGPKQNQCYWLPVGPESDLPKFGCWSCFEVMNSASLSLPIEFVIAGRPRLCDGRDSGVMWRSATGDYVSYQHSDPLTDDCEDSVASVLSARMTSSLTL